VRTLELDGLALEQLSVTASAEFDFGVPGHTVYGADVAIPFFFAERNSRVSNLIGFMQ
jgi:hypothetical protein